MKNKRKRKLSAAVIIGIVVLLLLFGAIADWIGYKQFTSTLTAQYKSNIYAIASEAGSMMAGVDLDALVEKGADSPEYTLLFDQLQELCNNANCRFIYVVQVSPEDNYGTIHFVLDVTNDLSGYDGYPLGKVKDTTNEEYRTGYQEIFEDGLTSKTIVRDEGKMETTPHITAIIPAIGPDGQPDGIICVEMPMDALDSARDAYLGSMVSATLALIGFAVLSWYGFMNLRLLTPVRTIAKETKRFAAENTLPERPLAEQVEYNDEFGSLAVTVDEMEVKTLDYFQSLNKMNAEKQRVDAELNLASEIQINMLPRVFPAFPDREDFDIYATMDPAKEVGGDLYDFFLVDETHLAFLIADVSGKGVPAALVMAISKVLLKIHLREGIQPDSILYRVNNILCDGNDSGIFVTCWLGILDLETGDLAFSNAGHNPPLVRRNGMYEWLRVKPGFVLGGMEGMNYKLYHTHLDHGDSFFAYTDGVTEATDSANVLYGDQRLIDYLNAHAQDKVQDLLTGVKADIDAFVGEAPQFDDMTMVGLEYR